MSQSRARSVGISRGRSIGRSVLVVIGIAAALLLSACDNGDGTPSAAQGTSPATAGGETATAAGSAPATAAVTESADAGMRSVTHAMGTTEVPAQPQRVVTLDTPHLDAALSLGVTPIGAVQADVGQGLPAYLGERGVGVEMVGTIAEPDLEAIAALEPDLILSAQVRHEGIYEQLSQIAPTVFTESSGTNWQDGFTLVAEALGRSEQGDEALASYRTRAEAVGAQVGAGGTKAAIVRFLPDETRIYGPNTFSGGVLTDVGFSLPDLEYDEYSMVYISPEQIQVVDDAKAIFSTIWGDPEASTRDSVTALWGSLPAVQGGCQFAVEDDEWMLGIGLIGAHIILDDIEALLAGANCGEQ